MNKTLFVLSKTMKDGLAALSFDDMGPALLLDSGLSATAANAPTKPVPTPRMG